MKKEKLVYRMYRYKGDVLHARKEIPYEIRLTSRLILDEICLNWNKMKLEEKLNHAIDTNNKEAFFRLSEVYKSYVW
ncbi:IDEAL domain-containing protein [Oceanobacillus chungangensis]|uniref:IDEAL domain-containing protein n=1 Tax=Oceanobacillus chungangensis TaxID=1229152 RepID=A0A3D8PUN2_9BACI|nr:IDEAL domain-containing protein [Oceanobacillus chungangensis]RDW19870.1 hypothetical protein CWR45_07355 [Oceanobacillus chungangensis]